jgi:LPS-assembly lipoprotein
MWWREPPRRWGRHVPLLAALAAAGLSAGCFEPLYSTRPSVSAESVQDKFAQIEIPPITAPKGTPTERVAVGMFNALQFNLHNGGATSAPTYRLKVNVGSSQFTAVLNPTSGRPDAQIEFVSVNFQLIEIATDKTVLSDSTTAHVSYDIPGSEQRFAAQRARRDAEDHAIQTAAEAVRNRIASYFVAGT